MWTSGLFPLLDFSQDSLQYETRAFLDFCEDFALTPVTKMTGFGELDGNVLSLENKAQVRAESST